MLGKLHPRYNQHLLKIPRVATCSFTNKRTFETAFFFWLRFELCRAAVSSEKAPSLNIYLLLSMRSPVHDMAICHLVGEKPQNLMLSLCKMQFPHSGRTLSYNTACQMSPFSLFALCKSCIIHVQLKCKTVSVTLQIGSAVQYNDNI